MALHSIRLHGGDRARLATEINADEKGRRVRHDRWGLARATMSHDSAPAHNLPISRAFTDNFLRESRRNHC